MITLEEYALTMDQLQRRQRDNEVDVIGGFLPDLIHQFNEATSKREGSVGSIPKTPIMFDQLDVLFLSQFPPEFYRQALVWRYRDGLIMAAEAVEAQKLIPENTTIELRAKGKHSADPEKSKERGEGKAIGLQHRPLPLGRGCPKGG